MTQKTTNSSSTPAKHKQYPLPALGSIVLAAFPEDPSPVPGDKPVLPKDRPALVLKVDKIGGNVTVAYGTSQKVDPGNIYPTEFVVSPTDIDFEYTGLLKKTKFDVGHIVTLPYTSEFFTVPRKRQGKPIPTTPRIGILSLSYLSDIQKANGNAAKK
ncbi:type II toxin-antitoxin system PemK/MazF family toxin [Leclercia adecarboxylata]|uniref:type II toxin-antitoxin system PemK/MazF family toxin n=1 Tax=Leclercia adecarboxylata TaxID=83655 RepID=UPI00301AA92A